MENNACKNLRKIVIITEKFTKFLQHKRVESVINQRNRIKSREIMKTYYSFEIQLMNDDFCRFDLSIPELNKIFEIPESLWRNAVCQGDAFAKRYQGIFYQKISS